MKPGPTKQFDPDIALTQAIEVFLSRGYEAASLTELTSTMGIGKKSLYDTFGNKRSLFLQALDLYSRNADTQIRAVLFNPEGDSTLSNIQQMLTIWLERSKDPESKGCMIGTSIADFDTSDEDVASALRKSLEKIEDAFTEALAKAEADGEIQFKDSPRNIARTLVCLSQGVALLGRVMCSCEIFESALGVTKAEILSTT